MELRYVTNIDILRRCIAIPDFDGGAGGSGIIECDSIDARLCGCVPVCGGECDEAVWNSERCGNRLDPAVSGNQLCLSSDLRDDWLWGVVEAHSSEKLIEGEGFVGLAPCGFVEGFYHGSGIHFLLRPESLVQAE